MWLRYTLFFLLFKNSTLPLQPIDAVTLEIDFGALLLLVCNYLAFDALQFRVLLSLLSGS